MKKINLNFLLSPWSIFSGIGLGTFIGIKFNNFAKILIPFGDIYLSLLQMCILPVLITAVVSSLGRMIRKGEASHYIGKLVLTFVGLLFLASFIGIFVGVIGRPGERLDDKARITLGQLISQHELKQENNYKSDKGDKKLIGFLKRMIPSNIFDAFNKGNNLSILFFCILFGIALGFIKTEASETALLVTEALYDAFQKLIEWVMYGLPFGLCCLFAAQVCSVGLEAFHALFIFVIYCYISAFLLIIMYNIIISIKTKLNIFKVFLKLKETLVIALGTSSSFAAIPSALKCLQNNFNVNKSTANFVVPLGINLNPQGSVVHFAISTIFIAQIYHTPLGIDSFFIIIIGSILAGMAATGVPGVGSLSMLALVLGPLGLPTQSAIILLLAVDPIIDPILTVATVNSNCAASIIISENE